MHLSAYTWSSWSHLSYRYCIYIYMHMDVRICVSTTSWNTPDVAWVVGKAAMVCGTVGSCVFSSGSAQKVFWQNAPFVLHVCVCTPFLHRAWCLVSFVQTTCGLAWTHAYHIQPGPARLGQGKHQRTLWSVPVHLGWKLLIKLFYYCVLQQRFGFLLSSTWQSQSGTSVAFQNQSE